MKKFILTTDGGYAFLAGISLPVTVTGFEGEQGGLYVTTRELKRIYNNPLMEKYNDDFAWFFCRHDYEHIPRREDYRPHTEYIVLLDVSNNDDLHGWLRLPCVVQAESTEDGNTFRVSKSEIIRAGVPENKLTKDTYDFKRPVVVVLENFSGVFEKN